jgi:MiaB/RimO family radical SAM methylthiotransferase
MKRSTKRFTVPAGSSVFVHQAFRCCPYAAMITSKIHDFLEQNSYRISEKPEDSDAVVINTCGFNASRAEQGERVIRLVRKRAPGIPVIVSGCLTIIERDRIREALRGVALSAMIGPKENERFDDIFVHGSGRFAEVRTNMYKDRYSSKDPRLGLYQILVSMGCMNQCNYCVIRKAKGQVSSKPVADVIEEVRRGIDLGHRDIFLVGDDISCYGMDIGIDAATLLEALSGLEEDCKFSCEAFEPSRFITALDRLLPSFESGRFAWVVLPVQSGSDRMLGLMGRGYTRGEVETAVRRLRAAAPGMILSTDFIFGYPSETREELQASLDMTGLFDFSNFNEYEQRPGTPPVDVSPGEMEIRRQMVGEFLAAQGSQVQVLTRNRVLPYDAWTGKDGDSQEQRQLMQWTSSAAARLRDIAGRGDGMDLAAGWKVERVDEEPGGVVLVVAGCASGETMRLLLSPRDERSPCMAFSQEYNVSLVSDGELSGIDEGRRAALEALGRILGFKQGT